MIFEEKSRALTTKALMSMSQSLYGSTPSTAWSKGKATAHASDIASSQLIPEYPSSGTRLRNGKPAGLALSRTTGLLIGFGCRWLPQAVVRRPLLILVFERISESGLKMSNSVGWFTFPIIRAKGFVFWSSAIVPSTIAQCI